MLEFAEITHSNAIKCMILLGIKKWIDVCVSISSSCHNVSFPYVTTLNVKYV